MIELILMLYTNPQKLLNGFLGYIAFAITLALTIGLWSLIEIYIDWLRDKNEFVKWMVYIPLNLLFFIGIHLSFILSINIGIAFFCRDYPKLAGLLISMVPYAVPFISVPALFYLISKTSARAPTFQIGICSIPIVLISGYALLEAFTNTFSGTLDMVLFTEAIKGTLLLLNTFWGLKYYIKYSENERENHPLNYIRWLFEVGNTNPKIEHTAKVLTKEISA